MDKKRNNFSKYIQYYIGSIFFKIVYITGKKYIDEFGDEAEDFGGYVLLQRNISLIIFGILLLPLYAIKCMVYLLYEILSYPYEYLTIYQTKIITNKRKLMHKEKVNYFNILRH